MRHIHSSANSYSFFPLQIMHHLSITDRVLSITWISTFYLISTPTNPPLSFQLCNILVPLKRTTNSSKHPYARPVVPVMSLHNDDLSHRRSPPVERKGSWPWDQSPPNHGWALSAEVELTSHLELQARDPVHRTGLTKVMPKRCKVIPAIALQWHLPSLLCRRPLLPPQALGGGFHLSREYLHTCNLSTSYSSECFHDMSCYSHQLRGSSTSEEISWFSISSLVTVSHHQHLLSNLSAYLFFHQINITIN